MTAPDLIKTDDAVFISTNRHALAVDALNELSVLCGLLRVVVKSDDEDMFAVRGLSIRMDDLINAVHSAVVDDVDQTDVIARRVGIVLPSQEGDA